MADELAGLRTEAEALGISVDGRWGADRLRTEIETARAAAELVELQARAEAAGVKVDRRWGADRLRSEIAAAADADPSDEVATADVEDLTDELDDGEPEQPAAGVRAGGYIDRGDGRGWVLEE